MEFLYPNHLQAPSTQLFECLKHLSIEFQLCSTQGPVSLDAVVKKPSVSIIAYSLHLLIPVFVVAFYPHRLAILTLECPSLICFTEKQTEVALTTQSSKSLDSSYLDLNISAQYLLNYSGIQGSNVDYVGNLELK